MTDPELVRRAEQAFLGALLARHGRVGTGAVVAGEAGPAGLPGSLRPADFTDPVHQAIYAALAGQPSGQTGGLAGLYERFRDLLSRLFNRRARDAAAYMKSLPGWCPDPANLPAYAAMIAEASEMGADTVQAAPRQASATTSRGPKNRQAVAPENPTLAAAGAWLDGAEEGLRPADRSRPVPASAAEAPAPARASRADETASDLAPDVARLARALRAAARGATRAAVTGTERRAAQPDNPRGPLDAEALQDQVLADLMRRPADGRAIAGWLPAEVFSPGPRRDLYELISVRLAAGLPVDPLIIAWEAGALRGPADIAGAAADGESPAGTALRLGTLDPPPGTADVLGRVLYAEQICANRLGPDWMQAASVQWPVTSVPDGPVQRPEPDPAIVAGTVARAADAEPGEPAQPDHDERQGSALAAAPAEIVAAATVAGGRTGITPATAWHPMPSPARSRPVNPLQIQQPPAPVPDGPQRAQRI